MADLDQIAAEATSAVDHTEGVLVDHDGPVLRITLDRRRSTMSKAMITEIVDALSAANQSVDTRVIVVTARGKNFCTGMDLSESNAARSVRPRVGNHQRRIANEAHRLIRAFTDVQLPVIAGVRGWAAGIGLGLTLSVDHVVADRGAQFWAPYVGRGFSPDSGTTFLLPRAIGTVRAKEMLMRGKPVAAETALAWGLVNEVVDESDLDGAVERIVAEYSSAATVSVGLAKNLVNRNHDAGLVAALHNEEFAEEVSLRSADFKEGIAALQGRRDPNYSGN